MVYQNLMDRKTLTEKHRYMQWNVEKIMFLFSFRILLVIYSISQTYLIHSRQIHLLYTCTCLIMENLWHNNYMLLKWPKNTNLDTRTVHFMFDRRMQNFLLIFVLFHFSPINLYHLISIWCIKIDNRSVCNNDKAIRLHNVFFCCLQFEIAEFFYFKLLTEGIFFFVIEVTHNLGYFVCGMGVRRKKLDRRFFFFFISNKSLTGEDLCLKPYNALT